MTIWIKDGVKGDLVLEAQEGRERVAELYDRYDEDLYVTFLFEGKMFQIQRGRVPVQSVRNVLGPRWRVVEVMDHRNCELDPKNYRQITRDSRKKRKKVIRELSEGAVKKGGTT